MSQHATDMVAVLDRLGRDAVHVCVRPLAGADHAASIMSPAGAQASAELIAEALS